MAAEAAPFAKVGGLGDVAGTLPRALAELGHEVWLLIPRHPAVARGTGAAEPAIEPFAVDFDWAPRRVELWTMPLAPGVTLALFGSRDYFERPTIYGEWDDDKRYVFFSKFGLEAVRRAGWRPDVVHVHDWHTAAAINWLAIAGRQDSFWSEAGTVITIHNLAYQGWTDQGVIGLLGVEAGGMLGVEWQRFAGRVNLLARGLSYADALTTVVDLIDKENWSASGTDIKGDAYEELLSKGAADKGSGAGQYFTPRELIRAIVDVIDPSPTTRSSTRPAAPAASCSSPTSTPPATPRASPRPSASTCATSSSPASSSSTAPPGWRR